MGTFAAVDLGAQSGRVAVGRFDGERLAVEEVHRFPNGPVRAGGTLHWDVLGLWAEVLDGLRAAARGRRLDAVSVDAWGVDFGLVDRRGRLLGNPVHYRDARRPGAVDYVYARIAPRELYERTGIQLLPINTLFELAAMAAEGDPALAAADRLLLVPDLFHSWLCGARTTEFTNATTTQCLDVRSRAWATDVLARLGVPTGLLPEIVEPATQLGPLTVDVAGDTGAAGAVVVAGGTHDTASAVAGTPLGGEHAAFLSVGTWSLVGVESTEAVVGDDAFRANVTNEGGVAGTFRVLRNLAGLWLLDECRRAWSRSVDEIVALARSASPLRSLVDPNDPIFTAPGDMPARIVDYCARTRQERPDGDGAIARCILESLALKHAETVDVLAELTGRRVDELHVTGGGANNELLCAWTAAAAGRPVSAGPAEATVAGNLLVQAMALGELSSLEEAREIVRRSFRVETYEPVPDAAWDEARERFAALSAARVEVTA